MSGDVDYLAQAKRASEGGFSNEAVMADALIAIAERLDRLCDLVARATDVEVLP